MAGSVAATHVEPRSRRRGAALREAVLDAAWAEFGAVGYYALTLESVAKRAGTSRTVIYQRWPNKKELILDTMRLQSDRTRFEVPDAGNLRDDMVATLRLFVAKRGTWIKTFIVQGVGFIAETGMAPTDVRAVMLEGRTTSVDTIVRRAADRGELDLARLPASVKELPFELLRGEIFNTLDMPSDGRLVAIVDEVFLPLVSYYQTAVDARARTRAT